MTKFQLFEFLRENLTIHSSYDSDTGKLTTTLRLDGTEISSASERIGEHDYESPDSSRAWRESQADSRDEERETREEEKREANRFADGWDKPFETL